MSQATASGTLSAGVARADITPPVGIPSAGFAERGPLTRLHDSLLATALVLRDGERTAALVSCDLLGLDADTVTEVRAEVQRRTGIAPGAVTVACTHTHYGPDAYRDMLNPMVVAYRANLIHVLAGIVAEAAADPQPAVMSQGWGRSDIGINRRERLPDGRIILGNNPTGPNDGAVGVMRIETLGGKPLACVVNFQTHPVSQTGSVDHISADYPGTMREFVEGPTGARCLFLQGACGNINARVMKPTYESARTLGVQLGCEVVRVWETCASIAATRPRQTTGLDTAGTTVDLPGMRYGSRDEAQRLVENLEKELVRRRTQGAAGGSISWTGRRLERARKAVESWTTGVPATPVTAELQAWRVGKWAMVTAPGEVFNEIGTKVRAASPFEHTFFVGYANGSIGYVPVPEAYAEGGYEVLHASQVDPGAAGILTEECVRLLRQLALGTT